MNTLCHFSLTLPSIVNDCRPVSVLLHEPSSYICTMMSEKRNECEIKCFICNRLTWVCVCVSLCESGQRISRNIAFLWQHDKRQSHCTFRGVRVLLIEWKKAPNSIVKVECHINMTQTDQTTTTNHIKYTWMAIGNLWVYHDC